VINTVYTRGGGRGKILTWGGVRRTGVGFERVGASNYGAGCFERDGGG
jgi:hypothetical protein